jgi:uncharacterized membrane protein
MSLPLLEHIEKDGFRLRGLELSRIDAFSDVVFGFALTLLVVSLEVPKTYAELHASLRGFPPFAICFLFLMMVWHAHYRFFRRFGTHDGGTIAINACLLFVVLFYVYPLKFLFTFLCGMIMGSRQEYFDTERQVKELMILFGIGFTTIYLLFAALYANALRQRRHLRLSEVEEALTRSYIVDCAGVAAIGALSCVVALLLPGQYAGLSGWVYWLIFLFKTVHKSRTRKRIEKKKALHQLTDSPH